MNEQCIGFREVALTGRSPFIPDLDTMVLPEGMKLIMRTIDRNYYINVLKYSLGMYFTMLREEISVGAVRHTAAELDQ